MPQFFSQLSWSLGQDTSQGHRHALQVILDCGGDDSGGVAAELLQSLTVLSPNETELTRLTGEVLRLVQGVL